jgi:hypothetical protein
MKAPLFEGSASSSVSECFLDSLAQRVHAFGAALDGGFAGACIAASNSLFATFAQAALESIPTATNSNRAVADHDRIGSSGHRAFGRG